MLDRPDRARSPASGLHLVGDVEDPVMLAELFQRAHEVGRHRDEAALALHGLEHHARHALRVDVLLEEELEPGERVLGGNAAKRVRRRRPVDLRRQRPEALLVDELRSHRHGQVGAAVKGPVKDDDRGALGRGAGDLDRVLDRLGPGVDEHRLRGGVAGPELVESSRDLDVRFVHPDHEALVQEAVDLLVHSPHDGLGIVTEVLAGDPAREVEILAPVGVAERRALGSGHDEVGGGDPARHPLFASCANGLRALRLLGLHRGNPTPCFRHARRTKIATSTGGFSMATVADATERRDALVGRLFMDAVGAFDLFSVYIGERLGLYRALADKGPLTPAELAEATGIHERYAREWLEHQAASDLLTAEQDGSSWRFRLPEGHDEALLDVSSLNKIAPLARAVVASIRPIDAVLEAMRSGGGVPYADYGEDLHESQAAFTRPLFENLLGKDWLGAIPEIHERLLADPPARIADLACGQGRSSIEIARAYPKVQVDGIDSDTASIVSARKNLAGSDVENRVTFHDVDAADAELEGRYDLVTLFEALHDMSYPVAVLQAARGLLADGGVMFIGDERTEESFTAPAGETERLFYGFSLLHCLPVGMVGEGAAGTGTVIRADTVKEYAERAGFSSCQVLSIENDFWRFYLLRP